MLNGLISMAIGFVFGILAGATIVMHIMEG